MKMHLILFAMLSFLSLNARAEFPEDYFQGEWTLTSHLCSSGVRPWDNFVPGRDEHSIIFGGGRFRSDNRIANCSTWSSGDFWVRDGRLLEMEVTRSISQCGHADPAGIYTYSFQKFGPNRFKLFIGPFGIGGPCPRGELVENVFERVD